MNDGVQHQACSVCGATQAAGTPIPATGEHTYGDEDWTPATFADCGNDGILAHFECQVCHRYFDAEGNELASLVDPATGDHLWEWVVDVDPGCYTPGEQHQACSVCGATQAAGTPVPAEHQFGEWQEPVAPDCGNAGTVGYYYCRVCGDYFDAEYNKLDTIVDPATGDHLWGWVTDSEPDCLNDGVQHQLCSGGGATQAEGTVIPATGEHSWGWVTDTAADCGNDGAQHQLCSVCGATQASGTVIPATGEHSWTWVTDSDADCEHDGEKHQLCSVCGATQAEGTVIVSGGHSWEWIVDTAANCGNAGVKHQKCSACGATQAEGTVIPATGAHTGVRVDAVAATATQDGYTGDLVCTVCGQLIEEGTVIPAGTTEPDEPSAPTASDKIHGDRCFCYDVPDDNIFGKIVHVICAFINAIMNMLNEMIGRG